MIESNIKLSRLLFTRNVAVATTSSQSLWKLANIGSEKWEADYGYHISTRRKETKQKHDHFSKQRWD